MTSRKMLKHGDGKKFFRKQIYRNPNPLPSGFGFGFLLLVKGNEKDATATF